MSKSTEEGKQRTNEVMAGVVDKAAQTGKKSVELATGVLAKTAAGGKSIAGSLAKGARELSDKAKADSYNRKMKKLNPVFEEDYFSEEFEVPHIICIVDEAVRRDIEECKGAVGWRENKHGAEVLYLYDQFVEQCGLNFVPSVLCDEVYYVDTFDKSRFIKLDCIFRQAHEEKMAELEYIAYSLGAKSCTIEIEESQVEHERKKRGMEAGGKKFLSGSEKYEAEAVSDNAVRRSGKIETKFSGNNVQVPKLKWFAHDSSILNLIEYRCHGVNDVTSRRLELSGASSATMSRKAASSIDVAVAHMGIKNQYAMEDKSVKESGMKIIFQLEF